jgi:hypothetical protein
VLPVFIFDGLGAVILAWGPTGHLCAYPDVDTCGPGELCDAGSEVEGMDLCRLGLTAAAHFFVVLNQFRVYPVEIRREG